MTKKQYVLNKFPDTVVVVIKPPHWLVKRAKVARYKKSKAKYYIVNHCGGTTEQKAWKLAAAYMVRFDRAIEWADVVNATLGVISESAKRARNAISDVNDAIRRLQP